MSLRLKTIIGIAIIEAILLLVLISTVLSYMRIFSEKNLEDYVDTTTTLFATTTKDAILSFDLASLETFVEEILKNQGVLYVRIYDSENTLLTQGGDEQLLKTNHSIDDNYKTVTDKIYDTETPISIDNTVYGKIQMGFATNTIESSINETKKLAVGIAAVEMLMVALFSFFLGTYLTRQLKTLKNASKKIAEGDFSHTVDINSNDEVGQVARSFNKMIKSLQTAEADTKQYQQELLELNQSLEERVQHRTEKINTQKNKLQSAYDKLQITQKQLVQSEKMASIGQLAAGVAHEINNPIAFVKSNLNSLVNYIGTYRELIDKHGDLIKAVDNQSNTALEKLSTDIKHFQKEEDVDFINEDVDTLLKESIDGTERVQEIVSGLKTYARSSDDAMEAHDINKILETTLKMLNNELKFKSEVITHLNPVPELVGNQTKLAQVFTNLIINAHHAIETKGTITIKTEHLQNGGNGHIVIAISDTGKGIAPENRSKLFDPFFTTKPVGEGTGLGLAICLGIINDHSGTIEVNSQLGVGTTFVITLPIN